MTRQQILDAIPHRDPFLLVDEIVAWEEDRIVCTKTFSGREDFFAGHYPGFPLVPGVLLCEAAMQAGATPLSPLLPPAERQVPPPSRFYQASLKRMVRPPGTLRVVVDLTQPSPHSSFSQA